VPVAAADIARPPWEYYLEKGTLQFHAGMNDYAILSFQRCLDINPGCYQAANFLGEIYHRQERMIQSLDYYRRSLAVNEAQADVHNIVGELYESFSERDSAFTHFRRAAELEPSHVKANCNLVRYYLKKGDRASAGRHFEISNRQAKLVSGGLLDRARAAAAGGRAKEASELYRKVMDEAPSLIEAYLGMYELGRSINDYESAVRTLERLAFVKPDYEKAYILLGYVYFTRRLPGSRKRHLDLAIRNLEKALELNPDNYETCYSLSEIYHHLKKDVEAEAWEKKGLEIEARAGGKKPR
jgi:tetratricopeptide (TPR) repeat protein